MIDERLVQFIGILLVASAVTDTFLTILYARNGLGLWSPALCRGVWKLFRRAAAAFPGRRNLILSFSGPIILVCLYICWIMLYLTGFAMVIWPALGTAIRAAKGPTSTDFTTAFYCSGFNMTTLGIGDLVAHTAWYRLLVIIEAAFGFSFFTLTVTYILSIYNAVQKRNSFALSLHHQTLRTGDAAVLVKRSNAAGKAEGLSGDLMQQRDRLVNLMEMHEFYPIIHFFRFPEAYYGLPRMLAIVLDTVSLLASLESGDEKGCRVGSAYFRSEQVRQAAEQYLKRLQDSYRPGRHRPESLTDKDMENLSRRYRLLREEFAKDGRPVLPDVQDGQRRYLELLRTWYPIVMSFADQLQYRKEEVLPFMRLPDMD